MAAATKILLLVGCTAV